VTPSRDGVHENLELLVIEPIAAVARLRRGLDR